MQTKELLTSCFGLGKLPVAPGTWGSIPVPLIFAAMCFFTSSPLATLIVMVLMVLVGSFVCVWGSPAVVASCGRKDPGQIVADEWAGQAVVFIGVFAVGGGNILAMVGVGFLLFRLFDITKPFPCKKLEKLPDGWGILADDLMAGVYAVVVMQILIRLGVIDLFGSKIVINGSLNYFSAMVLGTVQGLTEFLPVSSSGHLILFEHFMEFDPHKSEMLFFDLLTHVGTVLAIFVVFRKAIAGFVVNLFASNKYGSHPLEIYRSSPGVRFVFLAMIATVVTGVLGIAIKDKVELLRGDLTVVACMWMVTGTFLLLTDLKGEARKGMREFGITAAMIVGVAQAGALLPGISRSGITICAAILLGLHREWAVEFSFLLAVPAILGATMIQLIKDFDQISAGNLPVGPALVGVAVAFIVGIGALKTLIKISRTRKLKYFSIYCYILAVSLLVYVLSNA
jgi:undecaprenyl-diphosphatase